MTTIQEQRYQTIRENYPDAYRVFRDKVNPSNFRVFPRRNSNLPVALLPGQSGFTSAFRAHPLETYEETIHWEDVTREVNSVYTREHVIKTIRENHPTAVVVYEGLGGGWSLSPVGAGSDFDPSTASAFRVFSTHAHTERATSYSTANDHRNRMRQSYRGHYSSARAFKDITSEVFPERNTVRLEAQLESFKAELADAKIWADEEKVRANRAADANILLRQDYQDMKTSRDDWRRTATQVVVERDTARRQLDVLSTAHSNQAETIRAYRTQVGELDTELAAVRASLKDANAEAASARVNVRELTKTICDLRGEVAVLSQPKVSDYLRPQLRPYFPSYYRFGPAL